MDAILDDVLFPHPRVFEDVEHCSIVARIGNVDHAESPLSDLQHLSHIFENIECLSGIKVVHPVLEMESGVVSRGVWSISTLQIRLIEDEQISVFGVKVVVV